MMRIGTFVVAVLLCQHSTPSYSGGASSSQAPVARFRTLKNKYGHPNAIFEVKNNSNRPYNTVIVKCAAFDASNSPIAVSGGLISSLPANDIAIDEAIFADLTTEAISSVVCRVDTALPGGS